MTAARQEFLAAPCATAGHDPLPGEKAWRSYHFVAYGRAPKRDFAEAHDRDAWAAAERADVLIAEERAELEMLRRTVRVIGLIADDTFGDPVERIAAVREALRAE